MAIVTGANSGIGLETTRKLAERGAKVYMACRDLSKCEKARNDIVATTNNDSVVCRECDLSSQDSIRNFVKRYSTSFIVVARLWALFNLMICCRFKREEKRLDILVNNAGVMACPKSMTKEGIELQLGVNFLGHFLLTNLLLDLLKVLLKAPTFSFKLLKLLNPKKFSYLLRARRRVGLLL